MFRGPRAAALTGVFFFVSALALALALAPAPVTAQPADAASAWKPKVEPFGEGLLFRISGRGVPDSFAFATPFAPDPRITEVPPEALAALKQSRTFARPVSFAALPGTRSFDLAYYKDGNTLRALVGDADFDRLKPLLAERGIDERAATRMKPWAAWFAIVQPKAESEPIERGLAAAATRAGLKTLSIELAQDQVRALDTIPRDTQVALLQHALTHRASYAELLPAAGDAWQARSLIGIHDALDRFPRRWPEVSAEYRQVVRSLVRNRVVQVKHRLTLPLRQGRVFIAAGPMILYGSQGLLAALERDGYRIEKLW